MHTKTRSWFLFVGGNIFPLRCPKNIFLKHNWHRRMNPNLWQSTALARNVRNVLCKCHLDLRSYGLRFRECQRHFSAHGICDQEVGLPSENLPLLSVQKPQSKRCAMRWLGRKHLELDAVCVRSDKWHWSPTCFCLYTPRSKKYWSTKKIFF